MTMSSTTSDPTLIALQEDVAALKRDIGTLLTHLRTTATSTAQNAADQIEDGASRLYHSAAKEGCKSAKALGQQIEEQPALALLVLLGLGYLGGRLLTR
jgi:selenocysteine lyase/cysteine desulfurase